MMYDGSTIGHLFEAVDRYGSEFVSNAYHHLVTSLSPIMYLFATLYLGFTFLEIKRGGKNPQDLPFIILKIVAILTLALNYNYFCLFLYNVFTNGPLEIAQAITLNTSNQMEVMNVNNALDYFLKAGLEEVNTLFSMGSWTNPTYIIFGCLLFVATLIAVAIAVGLIFLAKIGSTILLALSPLFIFFVLFESTKGWFDSFIQHLFTYALIPVLTSAVLMIVLSVTSTTIQYMQSDKPSLKLLIPFITACLVQSWLFLQVPQKCASLASGFNIKGFLPVMNEIGARTSTLGNMLSGGQKTRGKLLQVGRISGSYLSKGGGLAGSYVKNKLGRFRQTGKVYTGEK